MIWGFITKY